MSAIINHLSHNLRSAAWWKAKGPVVCGQAYVEKYGQDMLVYRFKVVNGSYVDESEVPYGSFVRIEPFNKVESEVTVFATPFDDGGEEMLPVFKVRCKELTNINKFICKATECRQIVPTGTSADSGANVWESRVEDIDDKHAEKVTVTITQLNTVEDCGWDEVLNSSVEFTETLVQTKADDCGWKESDPVTVPVTGTFTSYEEVRCGWWVKRVEFLSHGVVHDYYDIRNYYWPPVLQNITFTEVGNAEGYPNSAYAENDYAARLISNVQMKEAYNGPCRAHIETSFGPAPTSANPTQMLTDAIHYNGLLTEFSLPACLHDAITVTENTNGNPYVEGVSQIGSWTATKDAGGANLIDWPASVSVPAEARPYKGQYLVQNITIFKPYS